MAFLHGLDRKNISIVSTSLYMYIYRYVPQWGGPHTGSVPSEGELAQPPPMFETYAVELKGGQHRVVFCKRTACMIKRTVLFRRVLIDTRSGWRLGRGTSCEPGSSSAFYETLVCSACLNCIPMTIVLEKAALGSRAFMFGSRSLRNS